MIERRTLKDTEVQWINQLPRHGELQLRVSTLNASQELVKAYYEGDSFAHFLISVIDSWETSRQREFKLPQRYQLDCAEYFDTGFAREIDALVKETISCPDENFYHLLLGEYPNEIRISNRELLFGVLTYSYPDIWKGLPI